MADPIQLTTLSTIWIVLQVFGLIVFLVTIISLYYLIDYFIKTRKWSMPYYRVKKSGGRLKLCMIDDGQGNIHITDGKSVPNGVDTTPVNKRDFKSFETPSDAISIGAGVPIMWASAEMETAFDPKVASLATQMADNKTIKELLHENPDDLVNLFLYECNGEKELKACEKCQVIVPDINENCPTCQTQEHIKTVTTPCGHIWKINEQDKRERSEWESMHKGESKGSLVACSECGSKNVSALYKEEPIQFHIKNPCVIDMSQIRKFFNLAKSPFLSEMRVEDAHQQGMKDASNPLSPLLQNWSYIAVFLVAIGVMYILISGQNACNNFLTSLGTPAEQQVAEVAKATIEAVG